MKSAANHPKERTVSTITYQGAELAIEALPESRLAPDHRGNIIVNKASTRIVVQYGNGGQRSFRHTNKALVMRQAKLFVRCGCDETRFAQAVAAEMAR